MNSNALKRKTDHLEARKQMAQEEYFSATAKLVNALHQYGPHVGLLSDLAACYYMTGQIENFRMIRTRIETEIAECSVLLGPLSYAKTLIFLGKLHEQDASISSALQFYELASRIESLDTAQIKLQAQNQILRLQSFLGNSKSLSQIYYFSQKIQSESQWMRTEIQHGLILAEIQLFSSDLAVERTKRFLREKECLPSDRRLIVYDLIEGLLRKKQDVNAVLQFMSIEDRSQCDNYEAQILHFAQDLNYRLSVEDLQSLIPQLSLLDYLKIVNLNLQRYSCDSIKNTIIQHTLFLLEDLDTKSKKSLIEALNLKLLTSQKMTLHYDCQSGVLRFETQNLQIKSRSFAERCLNLFARRTELGIEELNQFLFEMSSAIDIYDRTRVAFGRLNKELNRKFLIESLFIFTKDQILLNPKYEIKIVV